MFSEEYGFEDENGSKSLNGLKRFVLRGMLFRKDVFLKGRGFQPRRPAHKRRGL